MKRYNWKFLFTSVLVAGMIYSCGNDFLEKQPYGAVTLETLTANLKGANSLLIAAYSNIDGFGGWEQGNPWGNAASNWTFGSIAGGDAYKGSEANDQPIITPIERHEMDGNNEYVIAKWLSIYDGVTRTNNAIRAFAALEGIDEGLRTLRLAEGRFLRGFYHLEGYKMWGKIPYIDETITEFRVPNDADIMPQIQADLKFAVDNLPLTQSEIGRATKGAANALLARAYLTKGDYASAKGVLSAIITSGVYKLTDKYHDNFNAATRNNSEGVLVVQQAVNEGTEGDNGNIGDVLNFPYNGGPGGCCGFHQPSQNLVNAFRTDENGLPLLDTYNNQDVKSDQGISSSDPFEPSTERLDPRLDWTVGRRGIPYLDWGPHPGAAWTRDQKYGGPYSPKKLVYYKGQEGSLTSAAGWTKGYTANNVKLVRYSDVLLMMAECEVETGSLEEARKLVNQVRARAANPDGFVKDDEGNNAANYVIGLYNDPWTNKDVARKAVRHERRIELGMEGHRFFDLVRWGIAAAEKNAYFAVESSKRTYLAGAKFTAGKNEVYPIPAQAITLSAKDGVNTLTQNPGY